MLEVQWTSWQNADEVSICQGIDWHGFYGFHDNADIVSPTAQNRGDQRQSEPWKLGSAENMKAGGLVL